MNSFAPHEAGSESVERKEPVSRCWALLLAGGLGARLNADRPKAFVPLAGRPMLYWSMVAFARHPEIHDLLVVVPRGWEKSFRDEILGPLMEESRECAAKVRGIVPGGDRRQDSARLGLKRICEIWEGDVELRRERMHAARPFPSAGAPEAAAVSEPSREGAQREGPEQPLVLVHDAARPLVPAELISSLIAAMHARADEANQPPVPAGGAAAEGAAPKKSRRKAPAAPGGPRPTAVIPVLPPGETLKALDRAGRVIETVARDSLWRAQTPQAFVLPTVCELHEQAMEVGFAATDDAMLYEWRGHLVRTVPGSPLNLKVTFPQDLALLEAWLSREGRPGGGLPGCEQGETRGGDA